jgi:ribosomal-protein-alanine N-acetyltransferase
MDARYQVRPAKLAELSQLAAIERCCFSDPWTMAGIREMMQSGTTVTLVAACEEVAVGYLMARISGEEGEILNLAVLPEHRRQGVANQLLQQGLAALKSAGVKEAYLEVRESNQAALALYGAYGFRPVAVRPRYYRNPPEDALVLRSATAFAQQ